MQPPTEASAPATLEASAPVLLEIGVTDMTCAACVGRVERALKKVDGVFEASVNLATERAVVRFAVQSVAEIV